jgi:hypothetical protein
MLLLFPTIKKCAIFLGELFLELVMNIRRTTISLVLCCVVSPVFAQAVKPITDCTASANSDRIECICEDAENKNNDECLALPPPTQEATNFVGLLGPILGGIGVLGALAGGGGSTTTTTTTTSTN